MANQSRNRIPQPQADVAAAAQAAAEQVIQKVKSRSMAHLTLDDFIMNDPEAEVVKGNQHESGGWLHSPAYLEIFKSTDRRLSKVAAKRGMAVKRVDWVRASLLKGKKQLFFWSAEEGDLSAIPVKRYGSSAWFNLVTLLSKTKLTVTTGYRERYAIQYAPDDCPLGACLMLDLGKPLDRRRGTAEKAAADATTAATKKATGSRKQKNEPAAPTPTPAPEANAAENESKAIESSTAKPAAS